LKSTRIGICTRIIDENRDAHPDDIDNWLKTHTSPLPKKMIQRRLIEGDEWRARKSEIEV
jgi:hypothetical protein